ncbi:MAG: hypothetical protein KC417_07140, partial [Myxococcales bacterium]|nr:hypothetical protein [Myxococcales bacterium]
MLFLRTSAHSATARTWRILACLAGPLVAAGCGGDDAKTTPVEWTFEIDSEVESATTRIELEVTRGACGSEGETAFSLAAAYPLSAAAAKPRSFEDGAYCFHARAYVDTCGPIGVAAEDFTVPIEEEPLAVHIASDVDALQACGVSPCGDVDCPSFLPSNITKANIDLLKASNARVVLDTTTGDEASRIWVLNSDDGSIRFAANVFDNLTSASSVQTWRAAGAGDDDATGVTFKSLSPAVPGGASIGAFAFGSIHIAQGVRVMAEGSNALLLIAQRDISIDGTLDVGQWGHPGGTLAPPGGGPAVPSGVGSPGGESGVALGGGGGGSFGMDGAPGGKLNGGVPGGSAGALHGNESLVPLVAGSAGGNGATTDNEDSIALHGTGGSGGGAVELVAGAKLAVSSTGGVFSPGYGGTGGRGKDAEPSPRFGSGGGGG